MKVTHAKLDNLTKQAKTSPRLRMNLDLRNGDEDRSQSMLNAIETEASLPIHRHHKTTETMACLRIQRNSTSRLSVIMQEKIKLYLEYVEKHGFWYDFGLILKTFWVIVKER